MPVRRCLLGVVRGQCHPALTRQPAPHEPPPTPPFQGSSSPLIVSESSLGKRRKVQTLSYIAASRRHPRALDERSALPAPGADLRNTKSNGVWSEHHTLPDYRAHTRLAAARERWRSCSPRRPTSQSKVGWGQRRCQGSRAYQLHTRAPRCRINWSLYVARPEKALLFERLQPTWRRIILTPRPRYGR